MKTAKRIELETTHNSNWGERETRNAPLQKPLHLASTSMEKGSPPCMPRCSNSTSISKLPKQGNLPPHHAGLPLHVVLNSGGAPAPLGAGGGPHVLGKPIGKLGFGMRGIPNSAIVSFHLAANHRKHCQHSLRIGKEPDNLNYDKEETVRDYTGVVCGVQIGGSVRSLGAHVLGKPIAKARVADQRHSGFRNPHVDLGTVGSTLGTL
jgi:hypothetical protein